MLQVIGDEPAKDIYIGSIKHSSAVTNEVLSVLATLNKPSTGFDKLELERWETLDSKLSTTVVDQFSTHCRHLKELDINGESLETEADRLNMCDLASKLLDAQEDDTMQKLYIRNF